MKSKIIFLFILAANFLVAENLLTFDKLLFERFVTDKKPGANLISGKSANNTYTFASDRDNGVTSIIIKTAKEIIPNANYYFGFNYKLETINENATIIVRYRFFDKNGKKIFEQWSSKQSLGTSNENNYMGMIRYKAAAKVEISVYFRGKYKLTANNFHFSTTTPVGKNGNFIFNGSFENPSMFEFYPQFRDNGKFASKEMSKQFVCERSLLKAKDGQYSLFCSSPGPKKGILINMSTLRLEGIQKYQFSVNCYYELATASSKISASIGFKDAKGKLIKYRFPSITKTQGKWLLLKDEFYPPPNAASIFVLFWVNGETKAYLDDFYFGPAKNLAPKKNNTSKVTPKAASAIMLENNSNFALWCDRPFNKPKHKGLPTNFKAGKFYQLECAANESEPFTIVVNAKKKIADVKLKIADFTGSNSLIPASAIEVKTIGYVNLKNPENPSIKGWIADPLLPENGGNIENNGNLGFFVDVKVPAKQKAGLYTSNFSLLSNNKVIASIPVKLQVRAFSLPEISSFRSWFYAWATHANYRKQDSRPSQVIWDDFCQQFKEHRFTGNQAMHPPKLKTQIKDGKLTITNWETFDAVIEKWRTQYNFRCFPIIPFNFLGHYHGWIDEKGRTTTTPGKSPFTNSSWTSPESLKRVQEFAKAYQDHVEKRFPDCDFFAYLFDEPLPDAQANLTKITSAISAAAPKMKIFITKEVTPSLKGVNFWCHPFGPGVYDAKKVDKAISQGHGMWYYNWVVGIDDQQYIEARLYPWRIYTAKGTGGLLWQTVDCPKGMSIWNDLDKTHKCGGATIFYPPRKGVVNDKIIPSLRSKHIKEGIDDFDYMTILQNKINAKYPNLGRTRLMEILSAIFSNPPFVYDNNQELLYSLRKQIGDEIESFDKIPAVILSLPKANSVTELTSVNLEINAPSNTVVQVGNKTYGKVNPNGKLNIKVNLTKLGLNELTIKLSNNGKSVTYKRSYTLQRDKNLDHLATINKVAKNAEAALHLKKFTTNSNYSTQDRIKTLQLLNQLEKSQLEKALNSLGQGNNPLAKSIISLAKESYKYNVFDKTVKLLAQAEKINKIKNISQYNVKITPTRYKSIPAFTVDNGIIQYSFTIMGGRIYSYKVKGIECLSPGSFKGVLSNKDRLLKTVPIELYKHSTDFAGFGDENGCGRYQATLLDWDLEFVEVTPNKVAIAVAMNMTEKKYFRIKRIMTLSKGSNQLVMNYTITNLLSPSAAKSDDPNSYEWPWRGRFVPAIGNDGKLNDEIIIPNPGEYKLPVTTYDPKKPVRYERKSFPLSKNWMGSRDKKTGTGIVVLGDKNITHGYVWFDSVSKNGNYTLEFPRSTFGKTIYDKVPNSPFLIQPGCEANFTLILKGIYNSKDVQDFESKAIK
jgi:hypothetical protein